MVIDQRFGLFIMLSIFLSSVFIALESPYVAPGRAILLQVTDLVFILIFNFETILKIIALGFLHDEESYLRDGWNILDFIVVVVSTLSYVLVNLNLKWVRSFRVLRVLRPLRVISRVPELRLVVNSLFSSLPGLSHVLVVSTITWSIFGILGMQLFAG